MAARETPRLQEQRRSWLTPATPQGVLPILGIGLGVLSAILIAHRLRQPSMRDGTARLAALRERATTAQLLSARAARLARDSAAQWAAANASAAARTYPEHRARAAANASAAALP